MRLLDREPWQIIVGFALLGLVMAAASYAYALFHDPGKPLNVLDVASVTLCPT